MGMDTWRRARNASSAYMRKREHQTVKKQATRVPRGLYDSSPLNRTSHKRATNAEARVQIHTLKNYILVVREINQIIQTIKIIKYNNCR